MDFQPHERDHRNELLVAIERVKSEKSSTNGLRWQQ